MRVYIFVILITIFSGCSTVYKPKSFVTGGYSDMQLNETTFQISFDGNYYTGIERASDFALLRSAEVVLEHGYRYFLIVDSENAYTTARGKIPWGNYAYRSVPARTYGRELSGNSAPTSTKTIRGFKEKSEITPLAFEAEVLIKSIKQKYQIVN